jgi:hypothetical protein
MQHTPALPALEAALRDTRALHLRAIRRGSVDETATHGAELVRLWTLAQRCYRKACNRAQRR